MSRATLLFFLFLLTAPVHAEDINFREMTLQELRIYNTEGLDAKVAKAHRKAMKKATRTAAREARKNAPKAPYCSRAARSRGTCS